MSDGPLPQDIIDRVREATDLKEVVSAHLTLKQAGKDYKGLCPFHAEKTPSFSVSPTHQTFYCFGCQAGGNVFQFLMRLDGMTFPDAVRMLAARAGITLPSSRGPRAPHDDLRKTLLDVHAAAAEYYHRVLQEDPQAEAARRYVEARGLTPKTVQEFELGYAPPGWDGLLRELTRRGWSPAVLEQAGLIAGRREGGGHYDRFRDRLTFPIHDLQGRVIGFGGRLLGPGEPKYLNSPETPLYQKGRYLYAFERAKGPASRAAAGVVLVEGYMDALMAHQAGVTNVAATLGTALTTVHLDLIRRFTSRLVVSFDPDPAGTAAVIRLLPLVIESGLTARVVSWPGGEDPDEFIRRAGREAFVTAVDAATGLLDFAIEQAARQVRPGKIEDAVQAVEQLVPQIMRIKSRIEQDDAFRRLSEALRVNEASLRTDAKRLAARGQHIGTPPGGRPAAPDTRVPRDPEAARAATGATPAAPEGPQEEELLLHLLVHGRTDPDRLGLAPEAFTDPRFRLAASRLFQAHAAEGRIDVSRLLSHEENNEEVVRVLSALSHRETTYEDPEQVLRDCRLKMQQKRRDQELKALRDRLLSAERAGDHDQVQALNQAVDKLIRTRREAAVP